MRFVDTNVLLYAMSTASDERDKARIATRILEARDLALSVQVLQEFYVQATRTTKPDRISHAQAASLIDAYLRFPIQEMTVTLIHGALARKERSGLSYWDAAIVEAARMLSCHTVLTEDLADGRDYDGVLIENPFRTR